MDDVWGGIGARVWVKWASCVTGKWPKKPFNFSWHNAFQLRLA